MGADFPGRCRIEAWAPPVPGICEVFHARMRAYAYPPHSHDTWAVLIVDHGAIRYDLDGRRCGAAGGTVTILPPGVAHDGRPEPGAPGFGKRELYLDTGFFPASMVGAAVDRTNITDPPLRAALARLHDRLAHRPGHAVGPARPGCEPPATCVVDLDAEARLALIGERITAHLARAETPGWRREPGIAGQLREILDTPAASGTTLAAAAAILDRSVAHLVRCFTREFGLSPHAYLTGRRVDAARRLLLTGASPAEVATAVGFYDQAHLTRHFRRHTATTPAAYARSHRRARS